MTDSPWHKIQSGEYEEAIRLLEAEPPSQSRAVNLAIACINLGELGEAEAWLSAPQELSSDVPHGFLGVIEWIRGNYEDAVQHWRGGILAQYQDAAGGIILPSLIYFAGVQQQIGSWLDEGFKLLKKKWKPRLREVWPGPICGYLCQQISEEDFTERTFENVVLEHRRQCRVFFWLGTQALKANSPEKATDWFKLSAQRRDSALLEYEGYIARAQLGEWGFL